MPARSVSLALLVLLAGCATTAGIQSEPIDRGVMREYTGTYSAVLRAARDAVVGAGLAIDSYAQVNDSLAVIVAKKGASGFSWGELVRVIVQTAPDKKIAVRVLSQRRMATNVAAKGDYSETIFSNIDLALR